MQTIFVKNYENIQSVFFCVCVCSDNGMCSYLQTNDGGECGGGVRGFIYRVRLWYGVPPSGPFDHCTIVSPLASDIMIACILYYMCLTFVLDIKYYLFDK